jgi:hypothetical protein
MSVRRSDIEHALLKIKDYGGIRELSLLLFNALNNPSIAGTIELEDDSGEMLMESSGKILLE